jgi:menaquinone reductase, integral membrane subunit
MSETALVDRRWIARGAERVSTARFLLWLAPWTLLLLLGIYAAGLCFYYGLNQTNMDNRFAFGMWIFLDLAIIAMGAGAFFTGFLVYILKQKDLKPVLNSAVVVGLICYSGAVAVLMVDVGQPLRAWFTFWYPNTHSMLTEVTFCISCYLLVLILEYIPVLLQNRQLSKVPSFLIFEHQLHKLVPVLAGVGTFLSFFHQGSLGGLYGVLRGRPFVYRQGFAIWPSTFFLFILSAVAVGPSFLMLVVAAAEKLTGKQLVQPSVFRKLGFISGVLLALYVAAKAIDTYVWLNITSPALGFSAWDYYSYWPFSSTFLFIGTVPLGLVPAILFILPFTARKRGWLLLAATLACCGVLLNRFVFTVQTLALPTLPFDEFLKYTPSWQEVATFGGVIAYGVILYSLSYRYLPLFEPLKGAGKDNASLD